MDLDTIIDFLNKPETQWTSRGHIKIENQYEIKPQDFLTYAESDLTSNYSHNLINSLSNAKRALDCQVDILLMAFGFYKISKEKMWGFPKKIELIKNIGIIAPRVLLKINKVRNLMEHEYSKPTFEQVEDFVDIVSLFIASTDKFIFDFPDRLEIENEEIKDYWIRIEPNYKLSELKIDVVNKGGDNNEIKLIVGAKGYSEILQQFLKIGYEY